MRTRVIFQTFLLAAVSLTAASARAQTAQGIEVVRPELHLDIDWHGHPGVGGRIDIAVVPDGFIDSVHDELALSPGFDLLFVDHGPDDDHLAFAVPFAVQWNFYVGDWSLFPELGLALVTDHHHGNRDHDHLHLHFLFSLGARYHFTGRNALLMRLNWPTGLQIGITF
jgi:hypothetical protein